MVTSPDQGGAVKLRWQSTGRHWDTCGSSRRGRHKLDKDPHSKGADSIEVESRMQLVAGTMSKYKYKRRSGSGGACSMHYHRKEHVKKHWNIQRHGRR